VVNVAADPDGLADYAPARDASTWFWNASANQHAIAQAISITRPQGSVVRDRCGGCDTLPLNLIVGKELRLLGTHRFDSEFAEAVRMIGAKEIDLAPMVTQVLPASDAVHAFGPGRRSRARGQGAAGFCSLIWPTKG
jgi:L-idonate 5-dehydrogenase